MFKPHRILVAGALLAMASSTTLASGLYPGTLQGDATTGITSNNGDLEHATAVTLANGYTLGPGTGAFAGISGPTDHPLTLDLLHPLAGPFTLTQASSQFSFTATSVEQNTGAYNPADDQWKWDLTLNGNFKLGTQTGFGYMNVSFQQSDGSGISSSFTMNTIPEPSSIVLCGVGLAAAGVLGLRKRLA